uniref:Uncharacterized protein n=1 Tax=Oryza brachyantha TaxID=4533 RepID=J3MJ29_ORYBR
MGEEKGQERRSSPFRERIRGSPDEAIAADSEPEQEEKRRGRAVASAGSAAAFGLCCCCMSCCYGEAELVMVVVSVEREERRVVLREIVLRWTGGRWASLLCCLRWTGSTIHVLRQLSLWLMSMG